MQFHLPDLFFPDLVSTFAFGILAILLIIIGYIAFDKLTPKLDFDDLLNKGNLALAIVIGSFILGLCYVVGRVVAAGVGGGRCKVKDSGSEVNGQRLPKKIWETKKKRKKKWRGHFIAWLGEHVV